MIPTDWIISRMFGSKPRASGDDPPVSGDHVGAQA